MLSDTHRYICYGGARGGGKTWALRVKAILLASSQPGIKILVIRRTYPELRTNHILPMLSLLQDIARYSDKDKCFTFPNGSRIDYGYCSADIDAIRYQGQEYDILMIDEATTLMEEWYDMLKLCVRGVNNYPKRTYITCNPGGVGHEWVKRLFIQRDYNHGENPDDYVFIPAKVYDNTVLMDTMPEYVSSLEALPPEKRAAMLDGDWDSFEGRFFPEFRDDSHVVEPFPIPQHWRRYRALDYGLDMLACLWIAVSDTGDEYVYREVHEPDLIAAEAARKMTKHTYGEQIYATYAPPDLWSRTKDSGVTIADLFRDNGVDFVAANNDRINGWQQVKDHIKVMSAYREPDKTRDTPEDMIFAESPNYQAAQTEQKVINIVERLMDEQAPHSKLRVFNTCPILIRHVKALQYDDDRIGDAATEPHNITHICDALRYYCVSRTHAPKSPLNDIDAKIRYTKIHNRARRLRAT